MTTIGSAIQDEGEDADERVVAGNARRAAFTALAAVLALIVGLVFAGTTALTIGVWIADPDATETNPVVDLGFFALGGVLIGVGLVSQLRNPERHVAGLQQALVGLAALSLAGLLGQRVEPLLGGLVLLSGTVILAALHPAGRSVVRLGRVRTSLMALAVLAVGPAIAYALSALAAARAAGPSCFFGQCAAGDRFSEMAALALALVIIAFIAATGPRGWRLSAWTVGVAAVLVGLSLVALPDVPGSVAQPWGGLVVIWGMAVVVVTVSRPAGTRPPAVSPPRTVAPRQ